MKGEETNQLKENFSSNTRDLEESQRVLKDRLILVGQNLIEFREETEKEILNIKKNIEILKNNMTKIREFVETISGEINKFAKLEDLEILKKQAKIFQPREFLTKKEFEELKKKTPVNKK